MTKWIDSEQWLRVWKIAIKARRTPWFSSPRPVGANRHPEQFSSSGADPLGRYCPLSWSDPWYAADMGDSSITWEKKKKRHRDWECWDLSCTRGVASLSETEVCYISSTSALWWSKRATSRGLLLGPMSGNCRRFNPSDFSWLPVHLGTLVTSKIREDLGGTIFTDHIRSLSKRYISKLADVGNPLVRQQGIYLR
jgi:hypothetical protein